MVTESTNLKYRPEDLERKMGLRSLEIPLGCHSGQNCDALKESTHKDVKLPTFSLALF